MAAHLGTPKYLTFRWVDGWGRGESKVPSNSFDVPENLTTHYRALRDAGGYHVMVSGKDDLTKHSGYGPDGSYRYCSPPMSISHQPSAINTQYPPLQ